MNKFEASLLGTTALVIATTAGTIEYAKFLIEKGADPNKGPGYTPLHWASTTWESGTANPIYGVDDPTGREREAGRGPGPAGRARGERRTGPGEPGTGRREDGAADPAARGEAFVRRVHDRVHGLGGDVALDDEQVGHGDRPPGRAFDGCRHACCWCGYCCPSRVSATGNPTTARISPCQRASPRGRVPRL